jgi:tetratricopeptide (TPR) repeat protein
LLKEISLVALFVMATSYNDQTVELLEEAERLKLNCKHEESISLLENLLSDDPGNVAALEEIADNELSLERYERAVTAAKQAVALDKESYMGHYVLGFYSSLKGDWKLAAERLKTANSIKPNNPEILRCLGWSLFNQDEKVRGIVTLERSLNLDSENVLTLCDLGVCYMHSGDLQKAISIFSAVLDLDIENEKARECIKMIKKMKARKTA